MNPRTLAPGMISFLPERERVVEHVERFVGSPWAPAALAVAALTLSVALHMHTSRRNRDAEASRAAMMVLFNLREARRLQNRTVPLRDVEPSVSRLVEDVRAAEQALYAASAVHHRRRLRRVLWKLAGRHRATINVMTRLAREQREWRDSPDARDHAEDYIADLASQRASAFAHWEDDFRDATRVLNRTGARATGDIAAWRRARLRWRQIELRSASRIRLPAEGQEEAFDGDRLWSEDMFVWSMMDAEMRDS